MLNRSVAVAGCFPVALVARLEDSFDLCAKQYCCQLHQQHLEVRSESDLLGPFLVLGTT